MTLSVTARRDRLDLVALPGEPRGVPRGGVRKAGSPRERRSLRQGFPGPVLSPPCGFRARSSSSTFEPPSAITGGSTTTTPWGAGVSWGEPDTRFGPEPSAVALAARSRGVSCEPDRRTALWGLSVV
jgi:hypothetical protein